MRNGRIEILYGETESRTTVSEIVPIEIILSVKSDKENVILVIDKHYYLDAIYMKVGVDGLHIDLTWPHAPNKELVSSARAKLHSSEPAIVARGIGELLFGTLGKEK